MDRTARCAVGRDLHHRRPDGAHASRQCGGVLCDGDGQRRRSLCRRLTAGIIAHRRYLYGADRQPRGGVSVRERAEVLGRREPIRVHGCAGLARPFQHAHRTVAMGPSGRFSGRRRGADLDIDKSHRKEGFLMRIRIFTPLLMLCLAGVATSQTVEFEAASAKANQCATSPAGMRLSGSQLTIANVPLQRIAGAAFRIGEDRIDSLLKGPAWVTPECYDISAKIPAGTSPPQMPAMLQALLKARFGMTFHRETRDLPAYALTVAKSGLKAQPAKAG